MRLVTMAKDGALELNWMWLPAFIGQNYLVLKELERVWKEKFYRAPRTDMTLDTIHQFTIEWFQDKFKIPGLAEYLAAIEKVGETLEPKSPEA